MTNKKQEAEVQAKNEQKKFNYFEYLKFSVLKAYFMQKFKGESTDKITFTIKQMDYVKNAFFYKNGAFKFVEYHSDADENGKIITEITIKDLDIDATAKKETGEVFKIFNCYDISKAVKSAIKTLAA